MRLNESEKEAIISVIHKYDPQALILLFRSRVHDNRKGGGIDLLVISKKNTLQDKQIL